MEYKKFDAINVSSKFAICWLPIRVDTYKTCSFWCRYCFANCRKIMEFRKFLQVWDMDKLDKRLDRILNKKEIKPDNFLDNLINNWITWHCWWMSDPFQPIEQELWITKRLIDISNKYWIHILFSTKWDSVYWANINPELHTFQLSVTNTKNMKNIEPNVPDIESRYKFYRILKDKWFKVWIRIQPFIPNISTLDIVKMFKDADNFTLEWIKIVPQNEEHKEFILNKLWLKKEDFTQMWLLNLNPRKRIDMYQDFINYFVENSIPFSIADNDLHYIWTNKCCCWDRLVNKSTTFNNTAMLFKWGGEYTKEQLFWELEKCWVCNCKCYQLFTSNRQEWCKTVKEFFEKRFERKNSPFSPKFQYKQDEKQKEQQSLF